MKINFKELNVKTSFTSKETVKYDKGNNGYKCNCKGDKGDIGPQGIWS